MWERANKSNQRSKSISNMQVKDFWNLRLYVRYAVSLVTERDLLDVGIMYFEVNDF